MPVPEGLKHMVIIVGALGSVLGGGFALLTAKKTAAVAGGLFALTAIAASIAW